MEVAEENKLEASVVQQQQQSPSSSTSMNSADMEEDICRICQQVGEAALYHPCLCTGSIKYVHQDCLLQWLEYSKKDVCETCNHKLSFRPLYRADMPDRLPLWDLLKGVFLIFARFMLWTSKKLLIAIFLLALSSLITIGILRVKKSELFTSFLSRVHQFLIDYEDFIGLIVGLFMLALICFSIFLLFQQILFDAPLLIDWLKMLWRQRTTHQYGAIFERLRDSFGLAIWHLLRFIATFVPLFVIIPFMLGYFFHMLIIIGPFLVTTSQTPLFSPGKWMKIWRVGWDLLMIILNTVLIGPDWWMKRAIDQVAFPYVLSKFLLIFIETTREQEVIITRCSYPILFGTICIVAFLIWLWHKLKMLPNQIRDVNYSIGTQLVNFYRDNANSQATAE